MEKGTGEKKKEGENAKSVVQKKEGSKVKKKKGVVVSKDQKRFFVDYKGDVKGHELALSLLVQANTKEHGREVVFKDLVDHALALVTAKDVEKIKEESLSEMDKVKLLHEKYNSKHGTNLSLGEFLVERLKIS